ncbi:MAG: TerB family tellurite resistance protein [Cystobacter sp.]
MTTATDDRFHIELLKLLLHVAWSDEEINPREAQALVGAAARWKVPLPELQRLERCLESGEPLPAPNLGLLRQRADEALATVRTLIHSDGLLHRSEVEMLAQLHELLGKPPA